MKPYAESCDQNRDPILEVIQPLFADCSELLEIGSGTGQHAVYFAGRMPHLTWQCSDRRESHVGIQQWLSEAGLPNTRPPLALDVSRDDWPLRQFDAVFSANSVHIMHWPDVEAMFAGIGRVLQQGGIFALYGPFNYDGQFTSESNAQFDQWLKNRDPLSGVRNFEDLDRLAQRAAMQLLNDNEMPANNRILSWLRQR
ncbi:MAG: DUF938 domain-containing protein [Pseudomonadota bacterium]